MHFGKSSQIYKHLYLKHKFFFSQVHYVNDYAPVFKQSSGNYNVEIPEDSLPPTPIVTVSATDSDEGSQGDVYYAIKSGNIDNTFIIDRTSGEIVLQSRLDRESIGVYTLLVRAMTEKVCYSECQVLVKILDINDNAPTFAQNPFVV